MKKPIKISLKTFEDIQVAQEKYDIPFAANITQVVIELISVAALKDHPSVTISLSDAIMPQSYIYNPCIWARHFHSKVPYPKVRTYRPRGSREVCIYAGMDDYQPNFYKVLKTRLVEADIVTFPFADVPIAYQKNPHILVYRLRTMGVETKAVLTKDKLTIRRK